LEISDIIKGKVKYFSNTIDICNIYIIIYYLGLKGYSFEIDKGAIDDISQKYDIWLNLQKIIVEDMEYYSFTDNKMVHLKKDGYLFDYNNEKVYNPKNENSFEFTEINPKAPNYIRFYSFNNYDLYKDYEDDPTYLRIKPMLILGIKGFDLDKYGIDYRKNFDNFKGYYFNKIKKYNQHQ